jgi:hypothetical protein
VSGTEVEVFDGGYCQSDLVMPFGCASAPCEPYEGFVCQGDTYKWIADCVAGGWEICDPPPGDQDC